jgi:hypothetical protein
MKLKLNRREALKLYLSSFSVTLFSTLLTSCNGVSDVVLALSLVETVAGQLAQILLPGDTLLISVLSAASTAINESITELATSDSASMKFNDITGYFQPVLSSVIPTGTASTLVLDLINDVKNFLAVLNPAPSSNEKLRARSVNPNNKPWNGKLSDADKNNLQLIKQSNDIVITRLNQVRGQR